MRRQPDWTIVLTAIGFLCSACSGGYRGPGRDLPTASADPTPPGYSEIEGEIRPDPFGHLELWPNLAESRDYPLQVRYQEADDEGTALRLVRYLEQAWRVHAEELGFDPPLPYAPDGTNRFTAFLWEGFEFCLSIPAARAETTWEAYETFMIIDASGPCGGDFLDATIGHEFHQAVTFGYDPWESAAFRAASGTFAEDLTFDERNLYMETLADFQSQAGEPIGASDNFGSWYSYGASLFLFFLNEQYFDGSGRFLSELWEGSRGPRQGGSIYQAPGSSTNPSWVEALEGVLPAEVSFDDAVVAFSRWRYFTGTRSDGDHLEEASLFPEEASVPVLELSMRHNAPIRNSYLRPTGSDYILLLRGGDEEVSFQFEGDTNVVWVVQTMAGLSEHHLEVVTSGDHLHFDDEDRLLIIITALPNGRYHPDRSYDTSSYRLSLGR
jgi:hypothetical protein